MVGTLDAAAFQHLVKRDKARGKTPPKTPAESTAGGSTLTGLFIGPPGTVTIFNLGDSDTLIAK